MLGESLDALEHGDEVPSAIPCSERVDLVGDNNAKTTKEQPMVDAPGHKHRFERLGGGEEDVWRLTENRAPGAVANVTVPEGNPAAEPSRVLL
ncbi:hypothetical protein [Cryobacterium sp. BB307]|uniref:hypothetical protein n=1 Tax=Cryobacterium sp. BB307 TaxID=2716317 RepID=UPI0032BF60B4